MPGTLVLHEAVDDDGAALGLHAELFQAEILDIADDADRGDDAIDGERLRAALAVVDGRGDAVGLLVELRHLGAGEDLDALLLEALAREGAISASSTGRICGSTSTTVTSAPSVR